MAKTGKNQCICVLGGTGFVGRYLVNQLANQGHRVRILSRRRERHRDLLVLPTVEIISADVHDRRQLKQHFDGVSAVINLIGILNQTGRKDRSFQGAHVELARKIVDACNATRVTRLIQMSALKANAARGTSKYLRSKGEAENSVHTSKDINVTSFRPSVIFGPGDSFLNRFATLLRLTPKQVPFPLACPNAKFAPIYVDDVANALVFALNNQTTYGQHYNLCGPMIYTLKQLVDYVGELTGEKRKIVGLGPGLSRLQASILGMFPGKPFTIDNFLSLQTDSICNDEFPSIFGITPTPLETIAPGYLANRNSRGRYNNYRRHAHRDP